MEEPRKFHASPLLTTPDFDETGQNYCDVELGGRESFGIKKQLPSV